jgi:pyruvate dehydrogenase E2 component (dihydrolipoamide acetyltransferase)
MSSLPSDGSVTTDRVNAPLDTVELTVPGLGPAADRAVVVSWSKRIGERVAVDEPICRLAVGELEFEVHSTADGELTRILAEGGTGVLEHSALAQVAVEAESRAEPADVDRADESTRATGDGEDAKGAAEEQVISIEPEPIDPEFAPAGPVVGRPPVQMPSQPLESDGPGAGAELPEVEAPPAQPAPPTADPEPQPASQEAGRLPTGDDVDWSGWISPVVQKLADEHGIDLAEVSGTGIGGRIRKRDVLRHNASSGASGDA